MGRNEEEGRKTIIILAIIYNTYKINILFYILNNITYNKYIK